MGRQQNPKIYIKRSEGYKINGTFLDLILISEVHKIIMFMSNGPESESLGSKFLVEWAIITFSPAKYKISSLYGKMLA
ncbi:hypothetical protein RIR_jg9167.t1 [Rhizophagus irregularis DAOM 181602=DAOM 197198]|nr:hypothetical protein RIR_jg9167.t1 [Rhizophagus irregularis DAOM 181602=DAOM 197198]